MKQTLEKLLTFLLCFFALSLVYSPTIFIPYAFHDEYFFIQTAAQRHFDLYACHAGIRNIGRPLGAWVLTIFNWFANTLAGLSLARLVLIITLSLCGYFYIMFLRKYLCSRLQSFLIAIAIFSLPSFEAVVAYVGACYVLHAVLLGLCAALVIDSIEEGSFTPKANIKRVGGLGLLLSAILIYPSSAMFYWVIPAHILFISMPEGMRHHRAKFVDFFTVGILAMMFYLIILAFMKPYFLQYTDSFYNPYIVTKDYIRKIGWFVNDPLMNSLNLWNIFPRRGYAVVTILLLVSAQFLSLFKRLAEIQNPKERRETVIWSGLNSAALLFLIVLSFIPNLAAVAAAGFYRCIAALAAIILIGVIYSLKEWLYFLPKPLSKILFMAALLLLCVYGGYTANKNVFLYRAFPSFIESTYLKSVLQGIDITQPIKLYFILPDTNPAKSRYDEFGVPTSWYADNLTMFTLAILVELNNVPYLRPTPELITKKVSSIKDVALNPSTRIIDIGGLYEPGRPLHYLNVKTP